MSPPVRVAVVGFGWWGRTVVDVAAANGLDVLGVVDADPGAAAAAAHRGLTVWANLAAALKVDELEAVVLCTPHVLHHEQLLTVLGAGRHVFCEKPFCTTVADAREALALAEQHGLVVAVGHERRFEPAVRVMLDDARAGRLGTVLAMEGNFSQDKFLSLDRDHWRFDPAVSPVGPLSATGIHLVDLAVALLGEPTQVWARMSARGSDFPNGDTLSVTLGFASGATASINAVLATPFMGRLAVLGSTGWREIVDDAHPEQPKGWTVTGHERGGKRTAAWHEPVSAVGANLAAFADAVAGRSAYPVTPKEIERTVAAYEAIVRSVTSGAIEPVGADGESVG